MDFLYFLILFIVFLLLSVLVSHSFFYRTLSISNLVVATGFLLIVTYFLQVFTGVFLVFSIQNNITLVYDIHSFLPSVFIFFIYIHLYNSLYYSWGLAYNNIIAFVTGWLSLFLLIITCFSGYLIPWGQIAFWGTNVVTSFLDYFPIFGSSLNLLIWGGLSIEESVTKYSFKSLHILLGIFFSFSLFLHLLIVHDNKSVSLPYSNSSDIFGQSYLYPYFYLNDLFFTFFFIFLFSIFLVSFNDFFQESGNVTDADSTSTPLHIVPEWYFLPTFSVLKYFANASFGIVFGLFIIISVNLNMIFFILFNYIINFINFIDWIFTVYNFSLFFCDFFIFILYFFINLDNFVFFNFNIIKYAFLHSVFWNISFITWDC